MVFFVFKYALLLVFSILPLTLQAQTSSAPLFSIKPLLMLYSALAQTAQQSEQVLIASAKNPHDYQLSIHDLQRLQQTKTLYWLGAKQEPQLAKMATRFSQQQWLAVKTSEHAWLEQKSLIVLVRELSLLMPQQAKKDRAEKQFIQTINARFAHWQKRFKPYQQQPVLLGHQAFAGFAESLGLTHIEIYRSGHSHGHKADGMHDVVALQKEIAAGHIVCAFAEPDISFATLQRRYPQLQVGLLEPLAQSSGFGPDAFIQFIDQSAETIYSCVKNNKGAH